MKRKGCRLFRDAGLGKQSSEKNFRTREEGWKAYRFYAATLSGLVTHGIFKCRVSVF